MGNVLIVICLVVGWSMFLAFLIAFIKVHITRSKEKKHFNKASFSNEFFCLAMNRPIKYLDYKDMPGCSPGKCQTCRLAVFRDL